MRFLPRKRSIGAIDSCRAPVDGTMIRHTHRLQIRQPSGIAHQCSSYCHTFAENVINARAPDDVDQRTRWCAGYWLKKATPRVTAWLLTADSSLQTHDINASCFGDRACAVALRTIAGIGIHPWLPVLRCPGNVDGRSYFGYRLRRASIHCQSSVWAA